jgi:cell wall-associated NlpC family hydrolase
MPPGASSCAPIWADRAVSAGGSLPAGGFAVSGRRSALPPVLLLGLLLGLAGCTGPSPRFTGGNDKDSGEDESLHAEQISRELQREDDFTVAPDSVARALASGDSTGIPARRGRLLAEMVSYLGTPYRYGGGTRRGLDCSGFVRTVFVSGADLELPRSAREQYRRGEAVERTDLRFGDLVFFNTTGTIPSHVGVYLEEDVFAHASVSDGVTFSSLESAYYRKRFVGARRVLED